MKLQTTIVVTAAELKSVATYQDTAVENINEIFGAANGKMLNVSKISFLDKIKLALGGTKSDTLPIKSGSITGQLFYQLSKKGARMEIALEMSESFTGDYYKLMGDILELYTPIICSLVYGIKSTVPKTEKLTKAFQKKHY